MTDTVSGAKRSQIMSKIKSKNTKIERDFESKLREAKLHYQRGNGVIGKPDFIFKKEKVAVFIDSCFWHGCKKHLRMPKSNLSYWRAKITKNVLRDKSVSRRLKKDGWSVIRLWEHDLKRKPDVCMNLIAKKL